MTPIRVEESDNIIIIAPHPDDESIGCGGVLAMYPELCTIVVATDGSNSDNRVFASEMRTLRRHEFEKAMQRAGVTCFKMLDLSDGELMRHPDCFESIHFSDYSKVFLPYAKDIHPDHLAAYIYAINEMIVQRAYDAEIYQYDTRGTLKLPTVFVDITNVLDEKLEMIRSYESQIRVFDHAAFIDGVNSRNAENSGKNGASFEVFIKTKLDHCQEKIDSSLELELARCRRQNELYGKWLELKIGGESIEDYLKGKGISTACIYGWGHFGKILYEDLKNTDIDIRYILDRKSPNADAPVTVLKPDKKYEDVDIVIVSTMFDNEGIKARLREMGYKNVVTLRDIFINMSDDMGKSK